MWRSPRPWPPLASQEWLEQEIAAVEARLARLTADDPLVQRLLALKGISLVTRVTIRAEIGRFDRFRSGKPLARFCGLSPRKASSGQRPADPRLIKAGHPQLRTILIEAAHQLMRYDQRWALLNASMRARGKPGSVVAAAVANRWCGGSTTSSSRRLRRPNRRTTRGTKVGTTGLAP